MKNKYLKILLAFALIVTPFLNPSILTAANEGIVESNSAITTFPIIDFEDGVPGAASSPAVFTQEFDGQRVLNVNPLVGSASASHTWTLPLNSGEFDVSDYDLIEFNLDWWTEFTRPWNNHFELQFFDGSANLLSITSSQGGGSGNNAPWNTRAVLRYAERGWAHDGGRNIIGSTPRHTQYNVNIRLNLAQGLAEVVLRDTTGTIVYEEDEIILPSRDLTHFTFGAIRYGANWAGGVGAPDDWYTDESDYGGKINNIRISASVYEGVVPIIYPESVTLNQTSANLEFGPGSFAELNTTNIVATVAPANADDASLTWTTTDATIVTITENANGSVTVTAVGEGNAVITATANSFAEGTTPVSATVDVNVVYRGGFSEPMPDFSDLFDAGWSLEFGSNFPLNERWGFSGGYSRREGTAENPINHYLEWNILNQSGGRSIQRDLPHAVEGSRAYVTFDWRPGWVNIHSSADQNRKVVEVRGQNETLFNITLGANGLGSGAPLTVTAAAGPFAGFNHANSVRLDNMMALNNWRYQWYTVGIEFNFDEQEVTLVITERESDVVLETFTQPFVGTQIDHFRLDGHRMATNNITVRDGGLDNLFFFSKYHSDDTILSVVPPGFLPQRPEHNQDVFPQSWFINYYVGTQLEDIDLPSTIDVVTGDGAVVEVYVEWDVVEVPWAYWREGGTEFNPDEPGVFTFAGTLLEPVEGSAVNRMMITPHIFVDMRRIPENHARSMEWLDRGLVAVPLADTDGILVNWRILATEFNTGLTFNVFRNGTQINDAPISILNFVDYDGVPGDEYVLEVIQTGEITPPVTAWYNNWIDIPIQMPTARENPAVRHGATTQAADITYTMNDMAVADVTGNGQYEILVKWDPSSQTDPGLANRHTGETIFDLYTLEGELLWRINMGINITSSAHHNVFHFFDLNESGFAELAIKTAEGTRVYHPDADGIIRETVDGGEPVYVIYRTTNGSTIGNPDAVHVGQTTNPVTGQFNASALGRVNRGPEFLTVFDGQTGLPLYTRDYWANYAINAGHWGDNNNNRSDRFLGAVAYFPHRDTGEPYPTVIEVRGHYGPHFASAYQFIDGELYQLWTFRLSDWGGGIFGNHNISIVDIDRDGFDEVVMGSIVIRYDGTPFWLANGSRGTVRSTHGDAIHAGAFMPDGEIMVMTPLEMGPPYNARVFSGRTGFSHWAYSADSDDVGRGIIANITPNPGFEVWVGDPPVDDADLRPVVYNIYSGERVPIEGRLPSVNFRIFWTGDLLSELLDGVLHQPLSITKYNYETHRMETIQTLYGTNHNNWTKANPGIQADIFGDWREEIIVRTECQHYMRIYTTNIPTEYVIYTLMHDPAYRLQVAAQNVVYNQPPHLSFYLGEDIRDDVLAGNIPVPNIWLTSGPEIQAPAGTITQLSIGDVAGVIDQIAQTITFTIPESLIDQHNQFRGNITSFEATEDTLIFFAGGRDWPLTLGESAGVSTGNTVRVDGGVVYTIIITHPEPVSYHTVTFNRNDNSAQTIISVIQVEDGDLIPSSLIPANPEREGYEFARWTLDAAGTIDFDPDVAVVTNKTVYAQWRPIEPTIDPCPVDTTPGIINTVTAEFRESPGTGANGLIANLDLGTPVNIIGTASTNANWLQVCVDDEQAGGIIGYVSRGRVLQVPATNLFEEPLIGVTNRPGAEFREGPTAFHEVINILPLGVEMDVLGIIDSGNWLRVRIGEIYGYVPTGRVDRVTPEPGSGRIIFQGTDFRVAPGSYQPLMHRLDIGTEVEVLGISSNGVWLYIQIDNQRGFVPRERVVIN